MEKTLILNREIILAPVMNVLHPSPTQIGGQSLKQIFSRSIIKQFGFLFFKGSKFIVF
jgi:hypothetical protein